MKLLALLLILLPAVLLGQAPLEGRVVDDRSGDGLAFATLAIPGTSGSYSNAEGYYRFTPGAVPTDSVFISFIGYRTLRTTVAELRAAPTVRLLPTSIQLTEVVVRGDNERLYALLQRCRRNLRRWPRSVAKGYFQLATTLDGTPVEFMQNYYNVTSSGQGIAGLDLKTGRVAVQAVDTLDGYRSLGTSQAIARLTLVDRTVDFADHPLQLSRREVRATYAFTEIPTFSDAQTVHLRFEPIHEEQQVFHGELWMDAKTAELKKLILRHPALRKSPLVPIDRQRSYRPSGSRVYLHLRRPAAGAPAVGLRLRALHE